MAELRADMGILIPFAPVFKNLVVHFPVFTTPLVHIIPRFEFIFPKQKIEVADM